MCKNDSIKMIEKLVSFDTTSRESNLDLINFIKNYLKELNIESLLIHNEDGNKANLFATIGDPEVPGVMLSGHTDVVPVDGQNWETDPFNLTNSEGRLYGRGTSDMKSFIGIVLAQLPKFQARGLKKPLHLAFSYDEEIGCIGVRRLIDILHTFPIKPSMCIVGEPTSMEVVIGHKGKRSYDVVVEGLEAHSSLTPSGVNAIEFAARLINYLRELAEEFSQTGNKDDLYDVPYTTVHTGTIAGGTALNIVPKKCDFQFEFRYIDEDDPEKIESSILEFVNNTLLPEMHKIDAKTGIQINCANEIPCLNLNPEEEVVTFVKGLAGKNQHSKVAFGTEAGLFQKRVEIPTVVCGPGDIAQAHKPNEFIEISQIKECELFLDRLMDRICGP